MSMFHGHLVAVRVLLDVQFWSSVIGLDAATVVDVAMFVGSVHGNVATNATNFFARAKWR